MDQLFDEVMHTLNIAGTKEMSGGGKNKASQLPMICGKLAFTRNKDEG